MPRIRMPLSRSQRPAGDGADMILELADGAGLDGPMAAIMHARGDLVDQQARGRLPRQEHLHRQHADIVERRRRFRRCIVRVRATHFGRNRRRARCFPAECRRDGYSAANRKRRSLPSARATQMTENSTANGTSRSSTAASRPSQSCAASEGLPCWRCASGPCRHSRGAPASGTCRRRRAASRSGAHRRLGSASRAGDLQHSGAQGKPSEARKRRSASRSCATSSASRGGARRGGSR